MHEHGTEQGVGRVVCGDNANEVFTDTKPVAWLKVTQQIAGNQAILAKRTDKRRICSEPLQKHPGKNIDGNNCDGCPGLVERGVFVS